jgi:hypothetical protein
MLARRKVAVNMTGLKLMLGSVAVSAMTTSPSGPLEAYAQLGVMGLAIVALIWIYNDFKKERDKRDALAEAHAAILKQIMDDHSAALIRANRELTTVVSESNELRRDTNAISIEIKGALHQVSNVIQHCHDVTLAKIGR